MSLIQTASIPSREFSVEVIRHYCLNMFNIQKFISLSSIYKNSLEKVIYFDQLASTSDYTKGLVLDGAESGTLVIADYQTGGRGRGGKSWVSKPGEGLLFSLVLDLDIAPELWYRMSLAVGVAVAWSIEKFEADENLSVDIKWPNDVHIGGKKVAGILTEVTSGKIVIGVGINISVSEFPKNLLCSATSLIKEDFFLERESLLSEIIKEIYKWGSMCDLNYEFVLSEYSKRCVLSGKEISFESASKLYHGKALGIDHLGRLSVEVNGREMHFYEASNVSYPVG